MRKQRKPIDAYGRFLIRMARFVTSAHKGMRERRDAAMRRGKHVGRARRAR